MKLALLALLILAACLPFHYQDPPTCQEMYPPKLGNEIPNLGTPSPTPFEIDNRCELELEQVRNEVRDWQQLYYNRSDDCE